MRIVFEAEGFEVISQAVPPSIKQVVKISPHIIFLDLLLKGSNGKDICMMLKRDSQTKNIPVIMLSAHNKELLEEVSEASGADGYLPKPFDIDDLTSIVRKHLNK